MFDLFSSKTFAILGLGKTGINCFEFLKDKCQKIFLWDELNIPVNLGNIARHPDEWDWQVIDFLIISPGIAYEDHHQHPIIQKAKELNISLISDIEIFALIINQLPKQAKPKIIAITGTNGKSTCSTMLSSCLDFIGVKSKLVGNIGTPILSIFRGYQNYSEKDLPQYIIIELSSFQIPLIKSLKLDIAVIINITPDHLNRHGSMQAYIEAKGLILDMLAKEACLFLDYELQKTFKVKPKSFELVTISVDKKVAANYHFDKYLINGKGLKIDVSSLPLLGMHNAQNYAFVGAMLLYLGLSSDEIVKSLQNFKGLEHRQEIIIKYNNLLIINDSKATNLEAATKSLAVYDNIFWLLGGQKKDDDLAMILPFKAKIAAIYCYGQDNEYFYNYFVKSLPHLRIKLFDNLQQASETAFVDALANKDALVNNQQNGKSNTHSKQIINTAQKTILLSPACASFDQFKSFEERGKSFKKIIAQIIDDNKKSSKDI